MEPAKPEKTKQEEGKSVVTLTPQQHEQLQAALGADFKISFPGFSYSQPQLPPTPTTQTGAAATVAGSYGNSNVAVVTATTSAAITIPSSPMDEVHESPSSERPERSHHLFFVKKENPNKGADFLANSPSQQQESETDEYSDSCDGSGETSNSNSDIDMTNEEDASSEVDEEEAPDPYLAVSPETVMAMAQSVGVDLCEEVASELGCLAMNKLRLAVLIAMQFSQNENSEGIQVEHFAKAEQQMGSPGFGHESVFKETTFKYAGGVSIIEDGPEIDLYSSIHQANISEVPIEEEEDALNVHHLLTYDSADEEVEDSSNFNLYDEPIVRHCGDAESEIMMVIDGDGENETPKTQVEGEQPSVDKVDERKASTDPPKEGSNDNETSGSKEVLNVQTETKAETGESGATGPNTTESKPTEEEMLSDGELSSSSWSSCSTNSSSKEEDDIENENEILSELRDVCSCSSSDSDDNSDSESDKENDFADQEGEGEMDDELPENIREDINQTSTAGPEEEEDENEEDDDVAEENKENRPNNVQDGEEEDQEEGESESTDDEITNLELSGEQLSNEWKSYIELLLEQILTCGQCKRGSDFWTILNDIRRNGVNPILHVLCDTFHDYLREPQLSRATITNIVTTIDAIISSQCEPSSSQIADLGRILIEAMVLPSPCEVHPLVTSVFMKVLKNCNELLTWTCTYVTEMLKGISETPMDALLESFKSTLHGALCLANGLEELKIQVAQEFGWHTSVLNFSKHHSTIYEGKGYKPSSQDSFVEEEILKFYHNFINNYTNLVPPLELSKMREIVLTMYGERFESFVSISTGPVSVKMKPTPVNNNTQTAIPAKGAPVAPPPTKKSRCIFRKITYKNKEIVMPCRKIKIKK